jgi:putative membrane protein
MSRWTMAAVAIVLAACSSRNEARAPDTATTTMSPGPAMSGSDTTRRDRTASPGGTMSDANILAQEHGGDSAEVVIARYAKAHASDAGVKSFAQLLIDDHSKGEKEVEAVVKQVSITPQPAADDTTSQETAHTLAHLGTLKGHDLDTAFVAHEIQDHQTDIADAHKAVAAAQNAQVKQLVEKSLPELQKHLDRAQALDKKLSGGKG